MFLFNHKMIRKHLMKNFLFRSSNINESRQHTRNNNSNNNNNSDYRGTHPISSQGREIIQACFGNHHNEIGYRICMRVFEKRPDYRRFILIKNRYHIEVILLKICSLKCTK